MIPRIRITDKRFQYTPACATNVAKTFAAARQRMEAEAKLRNKITAIKRVRA